MSDIRTVDLENGRRLTIRHGNAADVPGLMALYERLSVEDLQRRFFSGAMPPRTTVDAWAKVAACRGGVLLVAEETEGCSSSIVAEAGFAPLDDGDAELGITVDRRCRGWLGPWLLDTLLQQAAEAGIPNLQALIAVRNTQMRLMLCGRGAAGIPDGDLDQRATHGVDVWFGTVVAKDLGGPATPPRGRKYLPVDWNRRRQPAGI